MEAASVGMGHGVLEDAAALLLGGLGRACVGGAFFALGVWLLCRLTSHPRLRFAALPASARFFLWWLACAKMLVGLFCAASFLLPVPLPARDAAPPVAAALLARFSVSPAAPAESVSATPAAVFPETADAKVRQASAAPVTANDRVSAPESRRAGLRLPSAVVLLMAAYLAGVLLFAGAGIRSLLALRRILRSAVRIVPGEEGGTLADAARRCASVMGLRRAPTLLASPEVAAPFVTGLIRPVIVVPEEIERTLSPYEMHMALSHEMAHIRRSDLWLGIVPALARTLLFFFPPAHIACRECAACREESCDALALATTGAPAADYGRLLLKVAASQQAHPFRSRTAALGMAAHSFRAMRRRLTAMPGESHPRSRAQRRAALLLLGVGLIGAAPWRITALAHEKAKEEAAVLPRYALIDLGTPEGGYSDAFSLNESGQVVGVTTADEQHGRAFLHEPDWTDGDGHRLSSLGVLYRTRRSVAYAINDRGEIAAASFNNARFPHTFLWRENRKYLEPLRGFQFSQPLGINNSGQIVGSMRTGRYRFGAVEGRAFLWDSGKMRDLGTLGGPFSHAYAINDRGDVVGKADAVRGPLEMALGRTGFTTRAFLWTGGRMRDLGTLPGGDFSLAHAVNEAGQVVGFSQAGDAAVHAFLYDGAAGGGMHDLGALPGSDSSRAYGVNDTGSIVGVSEAQGGQGQRATLWLPASPARRDSRRVIDLNTLLPPGSGWVLEAARAINNRGQIVGYGQMNGKRRAFLLTPIAPSAPVGTGAGDSDTG